MLASVSFAWASGQNGLNFQTYAAGGTQPGYTQDANGNITNRTLLTTGTVSTVDFNWGSGNVLNTGLSEGVIVRFFGFINIPTAGTYSFGGNADDGLRIRVNNTFVVNSWIQSGGAFRSGNITLDAGVVPIEVLYYESGGGAMVNLQWLVNGTWEIVPSSVLATASTFFASPPPVVAPSPVYGNTAITAAQTIKRSNDLSQTTGHNAQVEITGDANDVYILQAGGGHFTSVGITGNTNNVNVTQTTLVGARHYTDLTIVGSSNNLTLLQSGNNKTQFVSVTGDHNTVSTSQTGTGNHFLDLSVTGNNHTASVTQDGSGNHSARVSLDGNQPWNFNLTQQGSTSKQYSLPHSMTDGSAVSGTCNAIGGCNLTVNQQ